MKFLNNQTLCFHYQEKDYTCGPAALRMILETLTEKHIDEEILATVCDAQQWIGTHLLTFKKNLDTVLLEICKMLNMDNNFTYNLQEYGSIQLLQDLQQRGFLIMLNYKTQDDRPHWGVLKNIEDTKIILMDPECGPDHIRDLKDFNWSGGWDNNPTHQAFIAIAYQK